VGAALNCRNPEQAQLLSNTVGSPDSSDASGDATACMAQWMALDAPTSSTWVQVFEYFAERTPRSFVETRETSVVWDYKFSDYEFGKSQAQDMLQHLRTGSISNSAVDVVRGPRCVEVRTFGVNKGVSMSRMVDVMARHLGPDAVAFDCVLCIGHFSSRDESIFSFFDGAPPCPNARRSQ
jgi:trehalose 6-phosphate synthase/phosphatase